MINGQESTYLVSWLGQSISRNSSSLGTVAARTIHFRKRKESSISLTLVFALPIFTASHPATIVGVHVLNFCVRDGNRWTHMTINTNS